MRTPAQAGFRRNHSTLDHALTLRILMEESKRTRKPFFIALIDFSKAFDMVPLGFLGAQLLALEVPHDIIKSIATLYQQVWAMTSDSNDVALVAPSDEQLQAHMVNLTRFCNLSGMSVNLVKTKWMVDGKTADCKFDFTG
ncbi:hypothetical protein R1sor_022909 [Riccia sorocarpa]|uniref:Reverse transcriptase domain-containing protein n=1 Tax=Riccia sorocarpa TaxID=122646 RepID=A0ABD3GL81_9MARC